MTHEDLRAIVEMGLGKPVTFDARPHLAKFIAQKSTRIELRYDWIKDARFYGVTYMHPEIETGDGTEWISIWIHEAGSPVVVPL